MADALKIGDEVVIRCKVVELPPGGAVVVETEPADLPGSDGYVQRITLHHALQLEPAAEQQQ